MASDQEDAIMLTCFDDYENFAFAYLVAALWTSEYFAEEAHWIHFSVICIFLLEFGAYGYEAFISF